MIQEIKELNFPTSENGVQYATLSKATVTFVDMGEKTITSQVSIDGQLTPDFSFDWEVEFKGEKYIMPLRQPQASKENTSLSSKIDLTFQHWAIYQLKRWYFFTLQSYEAGVAVADQYIASVSLNLKNFCDLYGQMLNHYFGDKITIDLNPDWRYAEEPTYIDINYSYLWDVLIKLYELFAVRWEIVPNGDPDHYVIKVGYTVKEMSHIFEYGFEGGLMKVERQVQDDNIRNMLLGRGGDKNIPYRYFKDADPNNPTFEADPDWVPELANVYFDRLRSAEFRSYVQGWKAKHHSNLGNIVGLTQTYVPWAWELGYEDEKFNPVEYVKDDVSILKYGELLGGLDNNDEIYPSIQGVVIDPLGRVDQVIDVEQVTSDNVNVSQFGGEGKTVAFDTLMSNDIPMAANSEKEVTIDGGTFVVPDGYFANINSGEITKMIVNNGTAASLKYIDINENRTEYAVRNGEEFPGSGVSSGTYKVRLKIRVRNTSASGFTIKLLIKNINVSMFPLSEKQEETFDIWIKNIWQTSKNSDESDEAYAERVWKPILGDHIGNDAAVCFSSGLLSTSEDYEFKILGQAISKGIHYDTSKSLNGVQSHWRLTLVRSTADYDSLGKLVPNLERQGSAGDYFYFIGIELTHYYVKWAEQRLHAYKLDELAKVSEIQPSWVVSLDKIRIGLPHYDELTAIIEQLHIGGSVRIADKRFIAGSQQLSLYLQQITYKYNENANKANLTPDIEIVLGTSYTISANPVQSLQGQIDAINRQVGSISNIAQIVRSVGDNIYLRKDVSDRTPHNLTIGGRLNIGNFVQGFSGASTDSFGNSEVESIVVRSYMKVFELIYNRLNALEGDTSFADSGNIETVIDNEDGTYTAIMRKRWEGDFTAFQKHDIIFGYVNSIIRNESGSLEDDSPSKDGFLYYKAWGFINSVDRGNNTINFTLYADRQVPAQKNFPFVDGMLISRWGNTLEPNEEAYKADPEVRSFIVNKGDEEHPHWINTRQQSFFISTEQGNLVELMGVDKPILERGNYGVVLGQIPEGLLDEATMRLINEGQPYLYARGIVVQDLIRIGYEGLKVRTPNFRGKWSEESAKSDTDYYRITDEIVDVVSHDGALWQVNPAVYDVPPEDGEEDARVGRTNSLPPSDSNPDWIRLTSSDFKLWQVVPSVNTIYIRNGSYSTNLLQCKVMLQDGDGEKEITNPEDLDAYEMELVFSLDGVEYNEFWVRKGETVGDIQVQGGDYLDMGGNNVPWIEIGDYITLSLREKETKVVKDAKIVPVVKDGVNGEDGESIQGTPGKDGKGIEQRYKVQSSDKEAPVLTDAQKTSRNPDGWETKIPVIEVFQDLYVIQASIDADDKLIGEWSNPMRMTGHDGKTGKTGLLVVPCGVFNKAVTYRATEGYTPVVMDGRDSQGVAQYFALKEGRTFCGSDPLLHGKWDNPNDDYVYGSPDERYWDKFDSFSMIYAEILMADFAKLGWAVFKDEFMFSQGGYKSDGTYTEEDYRGFPYEFEPNFQIDFRTGHVIARDMEYYGSVRQKMVKITDENYKDYYDDLSFGITWAKAGGSIWLELSDTSLPHSIALPTVYNGIAQATLERARAYVGNTILIYNNSSRDGVVRGYILKETMTNESDENGHRGWVTKTTESLEAPLPVGCVTSFTCVLHADNAGYEQLYWKCGESCKFIK